MAPKQPRTMEDKLVEKETKESLSREKTIQEEDDSDSIEDDGDDTTDDNDDIEDEEDKEDDNNGGEGSQTKNPATATLATTETSENESEAMDSESEAEISGDKAKSMQECPGSSIPISNVGALLEKSVTKRPMTEVGQNNKEVKRMRMTDEEKKKPEEGEEKRIGAEETKKQLFQRLFSEEDEIKILKGMLQFITDTKDPYHDMDGFYNFVKASISFNSTKTQLLDKIRALRRKFERWVKRGRPSSKCQDQILFDLSIKIWSDKVYSSQSTLECVLKPPKKNKEASGRKKFMSSKQMAAFLKKDSLLGLDHLVIRWWDKVDEPKKRAVEDKMMKLFMLLNQVKDYIGKSVYEAFIASKTDV